MQSSSRLSARPADRLINCNKRPMIYRKLLPHPRPHPSPTPSAPRLAACTAFAAFFARRARGAARGGLGQGGGGNERVRTRIAPPRIEYGLPSFPSPLRSRIKFCANEISPLIPPPAATSRHLFLLFTLFNPNATIAARDAIVILTLD
jgi:hypothetical protein